MTEQIIDSTVEDELSRSYMEYGMSVIISRALPDVRDGLKPVHRRILYSMYDLGVRPDRAHVKCAKVVGDTMGRFHPHGDLAIYESLVRLAQFWSMRVPLIDPHGNFGSLDDGPAASRYTECRLSPAGMALLDDIRESTVDFVPSYDNSDTEPTVLPSAFPNLLVNGSQGIAVGMATNIAPHNLREVTAALQAMLENPNITLDEIMVHLPGPDFPTGALLYQLGGVRDAYATGKGAFRLRARSRIVEVSSRKRGLEFTEMPYQVSPEKVIARIKSLLGQKKLQGVADAKDLTDRKSGIRLLVECKTGFSPEAVLASLYRLTDLDVSFSINTV
jgi:DNA gyrase subunit A